MSMTALDLSPEDLKGYRPLEAIRRRKRDESADLSGRRRRARLTARKAAKLLRSEFGASRAGNAPAVLQQMTEDKPSLRPAVISEGVGNRLNEYRGFRHVVRNVYTYRFDPIKIENLVKSAPDVFAQLKAELLAFAAFLE